MRRSGRLYQLLCLLLAAAVLLGAALPAHRRVNAVKGELLGPERQAGDVGELDSFAMGLLLGGFRGPLVMYLWITAEEEKNREDTEKFMTRMELIGDLQPQFQTVYVHQSWNLAYNVSVQYTRPADKYVWVMAGIRFAEKGERRLPHNTDMLVQLGQLYFFKLGRSAEDGYFRPRFRHDSLEDLLDGEKFLRAAARPDDPTPPPATRWRFIDRLDGLLAEARRIEERTGRAALPDELPGQDDPSHRHRWPYGVSVFAVAFDYYLQAVPCGPHSQFGDVVISSQPAIACRAWMDEEVELAFSAESRLWPMDQPGQPLPVPTAAMISGPSAAALDQALFHCREAQVVTELARVSYLGHLARFPDQGDIYTTHLNDVEIKRTIAAAGENRLDGIRRLLLAETEEQRIAARRELTDARVGYLNAIRLLNEYIATEYRTDLWAGADASWGRGPYDLLVDQSRRAVEQIDALLK